MIETTLVKHGDHEKLDYEHEILTAVDDPAFPKGVNYKREISEIGGLSRMVMERLPGIGLDTFLRMDQRERTSRVPSTSTVLEITRGVAGAFDALSRANYLYRDQSHTC